jgi:glucokinase
VTAQAQAGDELARQAFATIGTWLGVGAALARSLVAASHRTVPPIVPAALGSEAGAIGAALLARRQI